ncbi:importin-beta 2 [Plasmodium gonderi]|uniref:Importin-beta 2 n=1 Tax=Plasmodium gonderi TaxID=77519 RepID=A0A1Y1JQC8_PLAGO|nr:importin-beta 2 [Plasmodium gonderi]GAW83447.1 importin-beta 2 [Plasmodium gonderi]
MEGTNIAQVLYATVDPNINIRSEAETKLKQAKETNFVQYINQLSNEFCKSQNDPYLRQIAGLLIKNAFASKDNYENEEKARTWINFPEEIKNELKNSLLHLLSQQGEKVVIGTACQIISLIAKIELSHNKSSELLHKLVNNIIEKNAYTKKSSTVCLAYLTEDIADICNDSKTKYVFTQPDLDLILTAIINSLCEPGEEESIHCASMKVLYNLMSFIDQNFKTQVERDIIMKTVIDGCKDSERSTVQIAAYECLINIVSYFYSYLDAYMYAIGPLTWVAIESDNERIAISAIEFWNTVCEEETFIDQYELQEGKKNHNIVKQAMVFLLPKIFNAMITQESEDIDIDAWTLSMASATFLALSAQLLKNDIVEPVISFVEENFIHEDWRRRDAAVLAYGSIMEGPDTEKLKPLVEESVGQLSEVLRDPSVSVRDTAAWTIGKITTYHSEIIYNVLGNYNDSNSLYGILLERLNDYPRVAANVCWVFNQLAANKRSSYNKITNTCTTELDDSFCVLCKKLIDVTSREDADTRNLREAAFNALNVVIDNVSDNCLKYMIELLSHMMYLLTNTYLNPLTEEVKSLQGYYCGTMQFIINRLGNQCKPFLKPIYLSIFRLFEIRTDICEDALLACSAIINVMGEDFREHLKTFLNVIFKGLRNVSETSTCKICIEMISDICIPWTFEFEKEMELILECLWDALKTFGVHDSIKISILTVLGDIATALNRSFSRYLNFFANILAETSKITISSGPPESDDWVNYVFELRDAILLTYSNIIYALIDGNEIVKLKVYIPNILDLIEIILIKEINHFNAQNFQNAVSLLGDLVHAYGYELIENSKLTDLIISVYGKIDILSSQGDEKCESCVLKIKWLKRICNARLSQK